MVNKVSEGSPHIVDMIKNDEVWKNDRQSTNNVSPRRERHNKPTLNIIIFTHCYSSHLRKTTSIEKDLISPLWSKFL
jgi:hypothetical protein